MSMLTGPQIVEECQKGNIVIEPFEPSQVNPNSYNLRLGNKLLVYRNPAPTTWWGWLLSFFWSKPVFLDMAKDNSTEEITIGPEGYWLYPGRLYLGHTLEYTVTHGFAPCVEGRSSVGRLGLQVHITAGFGDNEFRGDWTLELSVIVPLKIYAGVQICQIAYFELTGVRLPYKGKYVNQRGPKASRLWKEFL